VVNNNGGKEEETSKRRRKSGNTTTIHYAKEERENCEKEDTRRGETWWHVTVATCVGGARIADRRSSRYSEDCERE